MDINASQKTQNFGDLMNTRKISKTAQQSYIVEHFVAMNSAIFEMNKALMDDDAEMFIDAFVNLQWHERSVEVGSQRMMHELNFTESDLQINPLMKYIDQLGEN